MTLYQLIVYLKNITDDRNNVKVVVVNPVGVLSEDKDAIKNVFYYDEINNQLQIMGE